MLKKLTWLCFWQLTAAYDVGQVRLDALVRDGSVARSRDLPVELMERLLVRHQQGAGGGTLVFVVAGGRARARATPSEKGRGMKKKCWIFDCIDQGFSNFCLQEFLLKFLNDGEPLRRTEGRKARRNRSSALGKLRRQCFRVDLNWGKYY